MEEPPDHDHEVVGQFTLQAKGYNALTRTAAARGRAATLAAIAGIGPDDVVLDICCGTGSSTLALAPHARHVTGADLTPAMLEQARGEQRQLGIANADWVVADGCALPFADGAFTLVLCTSAFHHLADPRVALAEMVRVCAPAGRILVRDVTPAADKVAAYDAIERLRDPSHTHALTPEELASLGAGLPLGAPMLAASVVADLPLDPILAASFPERCTIGEVRAVFLADAESGEDRLGFRARIVDGEIRVSFPMTTALWRRE